MKITLYNDAAMFDDYCDNWCELLANSDADEIFLTCEWQATWWQIYQPGELWVLVVEDEVTGQWMGIAPWFIDEDETGRRTVRIVGCVDVTDYLDVIVRRGAEDAVYAALLGWLAEHANQYDEVRLCNVPQKSRTLLAIPAMASRYGLVAQMHVQDVCPVVALPDSFPEYFNLLDKKNRHEVRRKVRRATGLADWYIVGDGHDLNAELQAFMVLMAASSEEKAEFLENPRHRAFFEVIVPKVAARGWLQLSFLTINGERAAAYLSFLYNNRVLIYNSGHAADEHGHLSPGIVLLARMIEHAIAEGRTEFDFLRGNESYKYDMGGKDTEVLQLRITRNAEV